MTPEERATRVAIDLAADMNAVGAMRTNVLLIASAIRAAEHEARASGERELREALGVGSAWPVADVLDLLANAAEHLLRVHDCDGHGWEKVSGGVERARAAARALRAALAGDSHGEAAQETHAPDFWCSSARCGGLESARATGCVCCGAKKGEPCRHLSRHLVPSWAVELIDRALAAARRSGGATVPAGSPGTATPPECPGHPVPGRSCAPDHKAHARGESAVLCCIWCGKPMPGTGSDDEGGQP